MLQIRLLLCSSSFEQSQVYEGNNDEMDGIAGLLFLIYKSNLWLSRKELDQTREYRTRSFGRYRPRGSGTELRGVDKQRGHQLIIGGVHENSLMK